jgi:hypothetical protein
LNTNLRPTYQRWFNGFYVLWFEASNSYSIIDDTFKTLLDHYLLSDTASHFKEKLAHEDRTLNPEILEDKINTYLKNCNKVVSEATKNPVLFEASYRNILKNYTIKGKAFRIYYDSELVMKTIHPALAHLSIETVSSTQVTFDVYIKDEKLHLFENERLTKCVPQRDYHLIQGKFIMNLLCTIHEKQEDDWIGTFHGSTVTDGTSSLLFIGDSGKGKSTLCALLTANDFSLLADDVSPMLSGTRAIYFNPSAISIKEGAFALLDPIIENFTDLPTINFNPSKGSIKYIPCQPPKKGSYPCDAIILTNYKEKSETLLEEVAIKTILETLIPESWLSPNPEHAKEFLDWLETVNLYQLTYSDTKSVTHELSQLFIKLKRN